MVVCPQVKAAGICQTADCPHRHNVKICLPCGVVCDPEGVYNAHVRGKAHRQRTDFGRRAFTCTLCRQTFPEFQWERHIDTPGHINIAAKSGVSPDIQPEEAPLPSHLRLCIVCDRIIPLSAWGPHIAGAPHRRMRAFVAYRSAFEEAEKNKNGVEVSHSDGGVDFDVVEVEDATQGVRTHVAIKSLVPQSRIAPGPP